MPVYVPSLLYAVGVGAAVPAAVLMGLQLGLSASALGALLGAGAAAGIGGTFLSGRVVDRLGERTALVAATVPASLVLLAVAVSAWAGFGSGVLVATFVAAVVAVPVTDGVWSVARQSLLARRVPAAQRGRVMTTYSASQRLGRTAGPLLTALALGVAGPASGFAIHAVVAAFACILLTRATTRGWDGDDRRGGAPRPPGPPGGRRPSPWAAAWAIGLGMVVLEALRANRDLLVPLWGAQGVGLTPSRVAVALGVSLALELVLFYPAGLAVDRIGWRPVALACLALMAAGFAVMAQASAPAYWVGLVLVGLGNGVGAGIIKTVGLVLAPARRRADFLGRWTALAGLGTLGGPALVAVAALGGPAWAPLAATALLGGLGTVWLWIATRDRGRAPLAIQNTPPAPRADALSPPPTRS